MSGFDKRDGRPADEDDGRTIADMSMLDDRPSFRSVLGHRRSVPDDRPADTGRTGTESSFTWKERLLVVLGALKASLLIAAVYIVAFGLLIWLMLRFWL